MTTLGAAEFVPVAWEEVDRHLSEQLMIDPEWSIRNRTKLTWWPWFLAQTIEVVDQGRYERDPGDNWLHVIARTEIASLDEELGLSTCQEWNERFPLGAFVWEDGLLSVVSTLILNSRCRPLLDWFHEAVLAQATFAHLLADQLLDADAVDVLVSGHPSSGVRSEPDELLSIFADARRRGEMDPAELIRALEAARPMYREHLISSGWELGFSNNEVDFFNGPRFDIAVGRRDDSMAARFGRGLEVWTRMTPPGVVLSPAVVNSTHLELRDLPVSLLGRLIATEHHPEGGTQLRSYLTSGFLNRYRREPQALAINVLNAVMHCTDAVSLFLRGVDEMSAHNERPR